MLTDVAYSVQLVFFRALFTLAMFQLCVQICPKIERPQCFASTLFQGVEVVFSPVLSPHDVES